MERIEHYKWLSPYTEDISFYVHDSVIRTAHKVFEKSNSVYTSTAHLRTGVNQHSGKRWFRWAPVSCWGLFVNRAGNVQAFHRYGKGEAGNQDVVWSALDQSNDFFQWQQEYWSYRKHFSEAVKNKWGITSFKDVYPVAAHYDLESYPAIPKGLTAAFRAQNAREFTEQVFGKKNFRKDLLKATAELDHPTFLVIARAFRGLVPTDWIIDFLKLEHIHIQDNYYYMGPTPDLRPILKVIDPRSLKDLLSIRMRNRDTYGLTDTVRGFQRNPIAAEGLRVRNWNELHDELAGVRAPARFREPIEENWELPELGKKLDGTEVQGIKIVIATESNQLYEWGNKMHNCIGSYVHQAAKGSGIYGGVYRDEKLIANFEISTFNKNLRQLLGPCNNTLPDDIRQALEQHFKDHNVVVSEYWGSRELENAF